MLQCLFQALSNPCHTFPIFATSLYLQGLFVPAVMSIIDEITHVQQFIMTQTSVGVDINQIQGGQAAALRDKIARLPDLTAQVATQLVQLVAGGPWTGSSREQLINAVNVRLSQPQPVTACGGRRRSNQVLLNFQAYIPGPILATIRSDASDMVKIKSLVELCVKLGLDCPSEKTTQHILSVFVALKGSAGLDAQLVYGYVMEFKKMLKSCFSSGAHTPSQLVQFPDNPKDLPAEIHSAVYPQGNEPVDIGLTLVDIQGATASVACRRTSKLVRSSTSSAIVPSQHAPAHGDALQAVVAHFGHILQQAILPSTGRRSPLNLQFLEPRSGANSSSSHGIPSSTATLPALHDVRGPNTSPPPLHAPTSHDVSAATPPTPVNGQAPVVPKTPQQAANALIQALANRSQDDDDDDDKHGSPSGSGPRKRPAATMTNKTKGGATKTINKKGQSKGGTSHAKDSKAVAGISKTNIPAAVLKKFKNGCSRCRYIKGCTPSCWTRRGYE
jgi:hypothetical protein